MSQITIQCRLVVSESTRQQLWQLMAEKNTPLINELLSQIGKHPEFETWRQKGKHPTSTMENRRLEPLTSAVRSQHSTN